MKRSGHPNKKTWMKSQSILHIIPNWCKKPKAFLTNLFVHFQILSMDFFFVWKVEIEIFMVVGLLFLQMESKFSGPGFSISVL